MPEFDEYLPGTPSWVDLTTPDKSGSKAFYSALFGWDVIEMGPEAGDYAMFTKKGKRVAGLGPTMSEGQPASWTTYVSVDDADAIAEAAKKAGGSLIMEPMDVMDAGRMAMFTDSTGAVIAAWQPRLTKGAELANEAGAFCWNELQTRDVEAAKLFYGSVFGWGAETSKMGEMEYTEWKRGDASIGGMMDMPSEIPAEAPPYWLVYFGVEDTDASVAKARELGALVYVEPTDIPPGRFAVLGDPTGASLGIIKL
jgi:uncharacterized protein